MRSTGQLSASVQVSAPVAQGREFAWTSADFSRVQALIYKHAGISLHDGKHAMVYSRLSRRLRGRIRREMDGEVWRWFTVTAKYC